MRSMTSRPGGLSAPRKCFKNRNRYSVDLKEHFNKSMNWAGIKTGEENAGIPCTNDEG
jgi:hypothetical protein